MLVLHMKYKNLYLGTKAGKVLYKSLKNCSFSTVRLRNKTGLNTLVCVPVIGVTVTLQAEAKIVVPPC